MGERGLTSARSPNAAATVAKSASSISTAGAGVILEDSPPRISRRSIGQDLRCIAREHGNDVRIQHLARATPERFRDRGRVTERSKEHGVGRGAVDPRCMALSVPLEALGAAAAIPPFMDVHGVASLTGGAARLAGDGTCRSQAARSWRFAKAGPVAASRATLFTRLAKRRPRVASGNKTVTISRVPC